MKLVTLAGRQQLCHSKPSQRCRITGTRRMRISGRVQLRAAALSANSSRDAALVNLLTLVQAFPKVCLILLM